MGNSHASGPLFIGDMRGGNYAQVGKELGVRLEGTSSCWDDLRFPASRLRQGVGLVPDFDETNMGLLFPQNDATEVVYVIAQLPHSWKLGTDLHPHVHFVQTGVGVVVFKMLYRWYENGGDPTGEFIPLTASSFVYSYTSGSIAQIVAFPAIDGSGISSVSSILEVKLFRDDNVVTGDVLVKEFDIHYEVDSFGSATEYEKGE